MTEKQGVNAAEGAFRRHYDQVYRYLRWRTHDHHRAEELTPQQVFADAAESLRETGGPQLAWLYTVAKRRFADEARKRARMASTSNAVVPEYSVEVGVALQRALENLPGGQRQVVVLKLLRGARFAEIGEKLGLTEAAAKMRFVRALEAVRAELEREGVAP